MRRLGYLILFLATAVGIVAMGQSFADGLILSNMTQHVPWGLWIVLYIYFIGVSVGSFLLSTLIYVFGIKKLEPVGRIALFQALLCMLIGLFLIFMDLGHPERFFHVFTSLNPTSVLSWESILYTVYCTLILLSLYYAMRIDFIKLSQKSVRLQWLYKIFTLGSRNITAVSADNDRRWLKVLGMIGMPVAIGVHGGTGAIFAVAKARPLWFSGLFPIVFLVSAVASGCALLTFLTIVFLRRSAEEKMVLVRSLAHITLGFLCLDILLLISEMLVSLYGGIPREVSGWRMTYSGYFGGVFFWLLQLGIGGLVPIILIAHPKTSRSISALGLASLLVLVGILGVRINIVIPPLLNPVFELLPEAYHHVRYARGYMPSLHEWLVGLGSVTFIIWGLLFANKILPLSGPSEGGHNA